MLWNELLRNGNISLLESQSDTQYCICRNYNPNEKEDQQYDSGTYFCYWGDKERKPYFLSAALENFRVKTEENYIPRPRLEELATQFKDALLEDDKYSALVFFEDFCEMTESEMEWFGISDVEDGEYEEYIPCSENGDYSPSNPWDAPGMSIKDFI